MKPYVTNVGCALCAFALLMPTIARTDDGPLTDVLNILRQDEQGQFSYQETRHLELATAPWQAQGYLLTDAQGNLVKLQLQPNRVIMAISGETMYYYDAAQKQRHSMPVSEGEEAAGQILLFRNLLQGQIAPLQNHYDVVAKTQGSRWSLHMQPKSDQDNPALAFIEMSGDTNAPKRHLLIRQADSETSEYDIEKAPKSATGDSLEALLHEAMGE